MRTVHLNQNHLREAWHEYFGNCRIGHSGERHVDRQTDCWTKPLSSSCLVPALGAGNRIRTPSLAVHWTMSRDSLGQAGRGTFRGKSGFIQEMAHFPPRQPIQTNGFPLQCSSALNGLSNSSPDSTTGSQDYLDLRPRPDRARPSASSRSSSSTRGRIQSTTSSSDPSPGIQSSGLASARFPSCMMSSTK